MLTRFVKSLVVVSVFTAIPKAASAQDWSVGIGADPYGKLGASMLDENFVASIARSWSQSTSGLGFRAQFSIGAEPSKTSALNSVTCGDCSITRHRSFAELSAATMYTFNRKGSFRPYILAGPALYGIRSHYSTKGATLGNAPSTMSSWAVGITAGIGTQFKLFGKNLSLEQRLLVPQSSPYPREKFLVSPVVLSISF